MRLNKMIIKNFKGFHEQTLNFNNKSVVIFGINGIGKSTVLMAINYCFWPWLNQLNLSQRTSYRFFKDDIVRQGSSKLEISCVVESKENIYEFYRSYIRARYGKESSSFYKKNGYKEFIDSFQKLYLAEDKNMPIFVNYGVNRAILDIPLRIYKRHQFSKLTALEQFSKNGLDFRIFFEWYQNQENIENKYIKDFKDYNYQDKSLRCVRFAIETMLDNISNLKVKLSPLRMVVKKGDIEISFNQLSDGEKCTLALFGDLARRLAIANPNMNNPLEGVGIVLINKIELYMHPSWQRRVLNTLRLVFPNIQFIITTHSPLVLGEIDDDYLVLKLSTVEDGKEGFEEISTYGKDCNWILKYYMDTSERATDILEKFREFYDALEQCNYSLAQNILDTLYEIIGEDSTLTSMQIQLDMEMI